MPSTTVNPLRPIGHVFKTGGRPTPRHVLQASEPFKPLLHGKYKSAPPAQFAIVPKQLSYWLNDQYGDCVTAEEAFAKACDNPEDFIPDSVVQTWASGNGVLDGADLGQVLDMMKQAGFVVGPNTFNDGSKLGVDYSNEPVLQAALATGPVKIGIDSTALPSGAGNGQGWYATGGSPQQFQNEDHCVALCGYGPAGWLFQQLGVALPSALQATQAGYLLFTWSTIGFVDHAWIMSTVGEAWIRQPTTIIIGPEPQPIPPGPVPVPPSPPVPVAPAVLTVTSPLTAGTYTVGGTSFSLTLGFSLPVGIYPLGTWPPPPVPPAPPPPVPVATLTQQEIQDNIAYFQALLQKKGK